FRVLARAKRIGGRQQGQEAGSSLSCCGFVSQELTTESCFYCLLPSAPASCLFRLLKLPDVAPEVHAVPFDVRGRLVAARERQVERRARGGDAEDAPAGGQVRAVFGTRSPPVKNLDGGDARSLFEAADARARLRLFRVAARGEHDAGRGVRAPLDLRLAQTPARDRVENLREVALQAHEYGLRFGVSEADVVFEHA